MAQKTLLMNPKVDFYFTKNVAWQKEIEELRKVVLDCGLAEELKWGCPCYQLNKKNVVLIHVFKDYCALLFFKGALMNDPAGMLVQQSENVQSARQARFTGIKEIVKLKTAITSCIYEAIEIEKAGLKVELKKTAAFAMPEEFKKVLAKNSKLKKAFEALTPGRQRGYLLHFAAPKQPKTRESRIEKATPDILNGLGLND